MAHWVGHMISICVSFILSNLTLVSIMKTEVRFLLFLSDPVGWGCVMVFLQILWAVVKFTDSCYISIALGTVLIIFASCN